ncbi:MAG: sulfotransferase family protein, partial [Thermomicrobiales bacterium]
MADLSAQSPVFVIGTLRSGASLLSLALSQHPQVQHVLQNQWVEEFSIGLIRSFRAASRSKAISQVDINGIDLDAFFARFGETAFGMMSPNGSSRAIVLDSTPANLFLVTPLRLLFPTAKFFHVVRDANEVVESLSNRQLLTVYKSRYIECSVAEARAHWLDGIRAGMEAERAFGSSIVHRVCRRDLVVDPASTLEACFAFLNLTFDHAALRPFSSVPDPV